MLKARSIFVLYSHNYMHWRGYINSKNKHETRVKWCHDYQIVLYSRRIELYICISLLKTEISYLLRFCHSAITYRDFKNCFVQIVIVKLSSTLAKSKLSANIDVSSIDLQFWIILDGMPIKASFVIKIQF